MYKTFVSTLHCTLENGADLYVNERQKIQHYRARSTEERKRRRRRRRSKKKKKKKKNAKSQIFTSPGVYVNCAIIEMLYIHSFDWKSAIKHDGGV